MSFPEIHGGCQIVCQIFHNFLFSLKILKLTRIVVIPFVLALAIITAEMHMTTVDL